MKTYLIFKRQEVIDGVQKVVTKLVPVDIPQINSGEGWMMSGHTDIIDVVSDNTSKNDSDASSSTVKKEVTPGDSFESSVAGTAKLVRSRGVIKIVARRGKKTYNQTTPNGVCITDETKNKFFQSCREYFGNGAGIYEFKVNDRYGIYVSIL